jgi:Cys-tRNA(Pro) deacylase
VKKSRHVSETPATQWLRAQGVAFSEHPYEYVEHGGTAESARQLGVPEHAVVKTLVMQDERARPLIVLMHGDRQVSTKNLARAIGAKSVEPCNTDAAQRHSGYLIGGTSPFATRKAMPVFAYITCPDTTDVAPSATAAPLATIRSQVAANNEHQDRWVRTGATGLIASRSDTATIDNYRVATLGFHWARRN